MSKQTIDPVSVLHPVFEFWRICPSVTISTTQPAQLISGKFNQLSRRRPRFVAVPEEESTLYIDEDSLNVFIEDEPQSLECVIFSIIYAVLCESASLKSITVVHKDLASSRQAAEEDLRTFGEFDEGSCLYKGIHLQHAQSIQEGFQIRLSGLKDPKQVVHELTRIIRTTAPSLEFRTNEVEFFSTGVISIRIDAHHQVELYLEKLE